MIDFACKHFNLGDIIKCSQGLTKADFAVLQHLLKHEKRFTADGLAKTLTLDLSTAQRALKKLHSKELVVRTQKNFAGGGYQFEYHAADKKQIRAIILKTIDNWTERVGSELNTW